jgi:hypothetical protein
MPARLIVALLLVLATPTVVAANDGEPIRYRLRYDASGETMAVRLCLPRAAAHVAFVADRGAARYVEALAREHGPVPARTDDGWSAPDWRAGECLSYRAPLGRIGDSGRRGDGARHGTTIVTDPDIWLLRVDGSDDMAPEVDVELPQGYAISAPWHPLSSERGESRYAMAPTPPGWLARIAIGRFSEKPIPLAGGTLRLSIVDGADAAQRRALETWIAKISRANLSAYGRLPLSDVQLLVVPIGRSDEAVEFGQSTRGQGNALTLFVDVAQPESAFDHDWVAVHELSHLFHPYLGDRGSWLAEGLATYYQNVLRARAGMLTPEQAWAALDDGFARGRASTRDDEMTLESASMGENGRSNFGRIYWAGTAFWLEVDLDLRAASRNRLSVDEAMRRFDACCLPSYRLWKPEDFVAKLDALLDTDVFRKRFAEFKDARTFPDLAPVYRDLGIVREGHALSYDDRAPAADVRSAIMTSARAAEAESR